MGARLQLGHPEQPPHINGIEPIQGVEKMQLHGARPVRLDSGHGPSIAMAPMPWTVASKASGFTAAKAAQMAVAVQPSR